MASTVRGTLLLLVLVACALVGSQPTAAHPAHAHRKLQQQQLANGTAETDAAAADLLATAQPVPPALPADAEAELAAVAAAAPITKRACGTLEGTRSQRAAAERRFQQRLAQLKARGEDVSTAQAPVIQVHFHVLTLNNARGTLTQVRNCLHAARDCCKAARENLRCSCTARCHVPWQLLLQRVFL